MDRYRAGRGRLTATPAGIGRQTARDRSSPALHLAVCIKNRRMSTRMSPAGYVWEHAVTVRIWMEGSLSHQPRLRRLGRGLGLLSAVLAAVGLLAAPATAQSSSTGAGK